MDGSGDLLPGFDLRFVPDTRDVGVTAMTGTDDRGFCNQEATGDAGALFVEVLNEWERYMIAVCSCTGHWGHRNAMAQAHPSDPQGGE